MTPGVNQAKKAGIRFHLHDYEHDQAAESYGEEAAEKLGISTDRVFKTLVVQLGHGELAVAVIPVAQMLNMKMMAKAAGAKKAAMAAAADVERSTGYVLGGVSPLGQKKALKTFVHHSAENMETVFISAGRRGLEIELSPADLVKLTRGRLVPLCSEA